MGKELVISTNRHETKVAVLEDDQLVEVFFQRSNEYSLAGSIHKGRVTRVLPGMQSAFVDIGLERDAFLYVTDFFEEHEEYDRMAAPPEDRGRRAEKPGAVALPPAATEEAPAEDRGTDQESRDRRSRRSRRRRNRGRGFPESKYVSAAPSEPAADIQVLPGESLAKYHPETAGEPEDSSFPPELTEPRPGVAAEDRSISEAEPEAELPPEFEGVPEPEPEP